MPERRFIVFHVEMLFRKAHWSYWGIRAVAQITRVDPGVFDRVCGHVHLQTRCINKSFIAVSALKGLVLVVLTSVRLGGETIVHQNGNVLLGNKWQHSTHTSLYEMKAKFFRPASWRVAWRISHTQDGSTCTADRQCESWEMKTNTLKWMDTDGLGWWWPNPTTERKKNKNTEADEKPKTADSLTCCVAEGDWAVWSTSGRRSRCRVSLRCGCGHVGPGN